jgi:ubiquitin-conjugating enzyme E2 Z
MSEKSIFVPQSNLKRLVNDIKQINKNPLTSQGIYYHHDETDMLKGYAMIVGPSETPYEYGYYLFEFKYPTSYPFDPPTVTSCTQDGKTRFNPNLYVSGKVCVSILNTWSGDQWSSCQTISSVLLVLCTLLCKDPFTNEPHMTTSHPDCTKYDKIIQYKNVEVAIYKMLTKELLPKRFIMFYPTMLELFQQNKEKIITTIVNNLNETNTIYSVSNYNMNVKVNYVELLEKLTDFDEINKMNIENQIVENQ